MNIQRLFVAIILCSSLTIIRTGDDMFITTEMINKLPDADVPVKVEYADYLKKQQKDIIIFLESFFRDKLSPTGESTHKIEDIQVKIIDKKVLIYVRTDYFMYEFEYVNNDFVYKRVFDRSS